MFNKKSILTFTFLLNFAVLQLNASQIHQKLNSGQVMGTNPQTPLVGEQSESKIVPEYFKFKQSQTRTLEQIPSELKYIIGQFVGFDEVNYKRFGFDSFMYAICSNDSDAVQLLVTLQAHLHDRKYKYEHEKSTPLYGAIQEYRFACIHADIGLRLVGKEQKDSLPIVDYLLRKKIGINKPAEYENTPLHEAVNSGLIDITQRLITAQADLSVKNMYGKTPLDHAKQRAMRPIYPKYRKKAYAICTMLEQAGAPSSIVLQPMPTDEKMAEEYTAEPKRSNSQHWWE